MPQHHPGQEGRNFGERGYSDQELIDAMQRFAQEYSRSPKTEDFDRLSKEGKSPSVPTYLSRGGWNHFLSRAGLKLALPQGEKFDELSRPEYLKRFREYFKHNPNATKEDIRRDSVAGLCPGWPFIKHLGGLKKLREHFGINIAKPIYFSDKEIIFLEGLLAGKTQGQSNAAAGFSKSPGAVIQLKNRFDVNGMSEVLDVYKKWKADKSGAKDSETEK